MIEAQFDAGRAVRLLGGAVATGGDRMRRACVFAGG